MDRPSRECLAAIRRRKSGTAAELNLEQWQT